MSRQDFFIDLKTDKGNEEYISIVRRCLKELLLDKDKIYWWPRYYSGEEVLWTPKEVWKIGTPHREDFLDSFGFIWPRVWLPDPSWYKPYDQRYSIKEGIRKMSTTPKYRLHNVSEGYFVTGSEDLKTIKTEAESRAKAKPGNKFAVYQLLDYCESLPAEVVWNNSEPKSSCKCVDC